MSSPIYTTHSSFWSTGLRVQHHRCIATMPCWVSRDMGTWILDIFRSDPANSHILWHTSTHTIKSSIRNTNTLKRVWRRLQREILYHDVICHLHQGHRQRKPGTCWRCLNLKQFGARVGHLTRAKFGLGGFQILDENPKWSNEFGRHIIDDTQTSLV